MGEVVAGRFELVDLVGQGGMGSVWRAVDRKTGREVALKVLRQSEAADLLRFVRETALRVEHPHIVTPLNWAGEDDKVVFSMPLVAGGSVSTLLKDVGALHPRLAAEILRQLLSALVRVHGAGYVHRDVKPANLLLDATGHGRPHVYLTDFGIAAEIDGPRLTRASVVIGTPGYLAPEQVAGADPEVTQDLYAVGALARQMLTGVAPRHAGDGPWPVAPLDVPEPLWDLVRRLLEADPARRPQTAGEVMHRLSVPELAWTPECMGEVDIFDHVAAQTPPPPMSHVPVAHEETVTRERTGAPAHGAIFTPTLAATPPDGVPSAGSSADPSLLPWLALGALGIVLVVAALLTWAPWSG